jgi:hypothetical protein
VTVRTTDSTFKVLTYQGKGVCYAETDVVDVHTATGASLEIHNDDVVDLVPKGEGHEDITERAVASHKIRLKRLINEDDTESEEARQ